MLKDYYRLTKPGIVYSNTLSGVAGYLLASKWRIDWEVLLSLIVGMALIIASACVFNNYIDRGIDAKMARTKKRATVTGKVSGKAANTYASALAALGFLILTRTNGLTMLIGLVAIFSYVVLYGIAKRRSPYGTLVGTLPGAASLVAGYTAYTSQLGLGALLLFLIMVAWQMPHFYSIAIFRLEDYKSAGLPVWPAVKGIKNTKEQIILYIFAFILACSALSVFGYAGLFYRVVMIAVGAYWLWRAIKGFSTTSDTKWARQMFGLSLVVLLVFLAAISVGSILS